MPVQILVKVGSDLSIQKRLYKWQQEVNNWIASVTGLGVIELKPIFTIQNIIIATTVAAKMYASSQFIQWTCLTYIYVWPSSNTNK